VLRKIGRGIRERIKRILLPEFSYYISEIDNSTNVSPNEYYNKLNAFLMSLEYKVFLNPVLQGEGAGAVGKLYLIVEKKNEEDCIGKYKNFFKYAVNSCTSEEIAEVMDIDKETISKLKKQ
jgi:hypothetical protein